MGSRPEARKHEIIQDHAPKPLGPIVAITE